MKEEYKDFVGIYDESVPRNLCEEFVKNYEKAKRDRTIIDISKENKSEMLDTNNKLSRNDEVMFITPLSSTIYPIPPVNEYWKFLRKCFDSYIEKYTIQFQGTIFNDAFKIHKVKKSGGFHSWHYERNDPESLDRVMAYMTYLEVPKKGGETEFLHQSLRIEPIVGRTLIWPVGYTHMHRGNPPLDGEKMYITGWFKISKIELKDPGV